MSLFRRRRRHWSSIPAVVGAPQPPSDLQAWVSAVTTAGGTVSSGRQTIIGNLINSLKAQACSLGGSLWSNLDFLFVHAGEDSQQGLISIVAPAQRQATNEGAAFVANSGWQGNGTSAYVNLNYNPSANGAHLTENSASFGLFYATTPQEFAVSGCANGAGPDARLLLCPNYYGTTCLWAVNDASQQINFTTQPAGPGLYTITRVNASTTGAVGYFNGGAGAEGNTASTGAPNADLAILAEMGGATPANFDSATIALSFAGAGFDASDVANLNAIIATLASAIGF